MPTLRGGAQLGACLEALAHQTFAEREVIVVDNSGAGVARHSNGARVIENAENTGFGGAVNRAASESDSDYIAVLNDDTVTEPKWLQAMVSVMESDERCGMVAPHILLAPSGEVDSMGMRLARDGSSTQRRRDAATETLLPSGCSALYRRSAFEEAGGFDEDLFLYCEDTDLGLRLRWLGWTARYEPRAVVWHRYSQTSGAASERKAWYVERNRLRLVIKTFPAAWVFASFFYSLARYAWHLVAMIAGKGKASELRDAGGAGWRLPWLVVRAHLSMLAALPRLLKQRSQTVKSRRITGRDFRQLAARHRVSLREVAFH